MTRVAVHLDPAKADYPAAPPFSPSERYAEYAEPGPISETPNHVYAAVRSLLISLGLDEEHRGTPDWNPLGAMVRPGMTVVLKPNFVIERHQYGYDVRSLFTHGSVLRAVVDYVRLALRGTGRIIIGDAPLQSCDLERLLKLNGIPEIVEFYRRNGGSVPEVEDFRREVTVRDEGNLVLERTKRDGSYRIVDLGDESMLRDVSEGYRNYRVTNYDVSVMARHHDRRVNEYFIAQSILDADVVINLPKLKTHRKAGMTGALKNLIGINCNKDCLPHHRFGSTAEGSDEYLHRDPVKKLATMLIERQDVTEHHAVQKVLSYPIKALLLADRLVRRDPFREGSWYGNDTLWRTILDLNRILLYADRNGRVTSERQRTVFHLVDAIIAGDHEGPIEPTPKACGLMLAGDNAVAVDMVAAAAMGFDPERIPVIGRAWDPHRLAVSPADGQPPVATLNGTTMPFETFSRTVDLGFVPTSGWAGKIERQNGRRA